MDLRVRKTEKAIAQAFLELRAQKPLERITVRELCERAVINKSTFYMHYADLYALSDALETQVVESVMERVEHPELVLRHPGLFTRELFAAYVSQEDRIGTLFSGDRSGRLIGKIEQSLRRLVFAGRPGCRGDPAENIILSYLVYGAYHAFSNNSHYGVDQVVEVLSRIADETKGLFAACNTPPDARTPGE